MLPYAIKGVGAVGFRPGTYLPLGYVSEIAVGVGERGDDRSLLTLHNGECVLNFPISCVCGNVAEVYIL